MVKYTSELREFKKQGITLLISDHLFKIGRYDDYKLVVSFNGKNSNDIETLDKDAKTQFHLVLDKANFDIVTVKDIDYIFNTDNTKERHITQVLRYLGVDYDTIINDYDLEQIEICDNGDVHVDGAIVNTRLSIYEVDRY